MILKYLKSLKLRSKNYSELQRNEQEAVKSYCSANDLDVLCSIFESGDIDMERFIELLAAAIPDSRLRRQKGVLTNQYSNSYHKALANRSDLLEKIKQVMKHKRGLELLMETDDYLLFPLSVVVKIQYDLLMIDNYIKINTKVVSRIE